LVFTASLLDVQHLKRVSVEIGRQVCLFNVSLGKALNGIEHLLLLHLFNPVKCLAQLLLTEHLLLLHWFFLTVRKRVKYFKQIKRCNNRQYLQRGDLGAEPQRFEIFS